MEKTSPYFTIQNKLKQQGKKFIKRRQQAQNPLSPQKKFFCTRTSAESLSPPVPVNPGGRDHQTAGFNPQFVAHKSLSREVRSQIGWPYFILCSPRNVDLFYFLASIMAVYVTKNCLLFGNSLSEVLLSLQIKSVLTTKGF